MNQIEEVRELVCAPKYLEEGESFKEGMSRIADTLKDDYEHFKTTQEIMLDRRFLPGGRVQAAVGAARQVTAFNCYVGDDIEDSMRGIFSALGRGADTLRLGGGDGWCFSTIRPKGSLIKSLNSFASGPISYMTVWDAMCETIKSAGHRRGAMMATMHVWHPDIEEFITCKQQAGKLTNFNISVLITDKFMKAAENDEMFDLEFGGTVYKTVNARMLWNKIMRNTWDHAEPGVIFIDRINHKNNLWYCENITSTNPCGEQPLPPHGACLLGSFNLVKYCKFRYDDAQRIDDVYFDWEQFKKDIPPIIRMMDNVIDNTIYPLPEQEAEAKSKRRMGIGIMGFANASAFLGYDYGSDASLLFLTEVLATLRDYAYRTSVELAKEKGAFPAFDEEKYPQGQFIKTLPLDLQADIATYGIRNSHLLSIAPTGTISLWAGNVSSGIEPVFELRYNRNVYMPDGTIKKFQLEDYAYDRWGIQDKTSGDISVDQHVSVLNVASNLVDSACSKTANIGDDITFDEFKEVYRKAYEGGASGCTTYRPAAFRMEGDVRGAVLERIEEEDIVEGAACFINEYGERECAD